VGRSWNNLIIISLYPDKTSQSYSFLAEKQKIISKMQAPAPDTSTKVIGMAEKLHVVPNETKSSAVVEAFDNYPIVAAITGWDEIGSLSSEITTSLLAKQASTICEQFREEEKSEPERPASKRRKIGTPSEDDQHSGEDEQQAISCDEHSSTSSESLPGCVSHQVDRMARMSKLMLQMERYHRLVRMEMIAMAEDSGIDLVFP
jgi:hypothetical protein